MNINKIIRESVQKVLLKESFASDEVRRAVEEHGGVDQEAMDYLPSNGLFITDAIKVYDTIKSENLADLFRALFSGYQTARFVLKDDYVFIPCKDGCLLLCLIEDEYNYSNQAKVAYKNSKKIENRSDNARMNVQQSIGDFDGTVLPHQSTRFASRYMRRYDWDNKDHNYLSTIRNQYRIRKARLAKEKNK